MAYGQPVQAIPMAMAQPVVGQPVMAQPAAAQYQQAQHPQTFIFQQQQQQQPSAMEIHYHHPDGRRDDDDPTCGWILFVMGLIFTPLFCCLGACATSGDQRGPRVRQAFRFNCFGSVFCSAVFFYGSSSQSPRVPPTQELRRLRAPTWPDMRPTRRRRSLPPNSLRSPCRRRPCRRPMRPAAAPPPVNPLP